MKKVRKVLACVLCVCMLMAMSVTAFAAEPRAMVTKCSKCGVGKVTTYTSRAYEHDEHFDCVHGYNNGSSCQYGDDEADAAMRYVQVWDPNGYKRTLQYYASSYSLYGYSWRWTETLVD